MPYGYAIRNHADMSLQDLFVQYPGARSYHPRGFISLAPLLNRSGRLVPSTPGGVPGTASAATPIAHIDPPRPHTDRPYYPWWSRIFSSRMRVKKLYVVPNKQMVELLHPGYRMRYTPVTYRSDLLPKYFSSGYVPSGPQTVIETAKGTDMKRYCRTCKNKDLGGAPCCDCLKSVKDLPGWEPQNKFDGQRGEKSSEDILPGGADDRTCDTCFHEMETVDSECCHGCHEIILTSCPPKRSMSGWIPKDQPGAGKWTETFIPLDGKKVSKRVAIGSYGHPGGCHMCKEYYLLTAFTMSGSCKDCNRYTRHVAKMQEPDEDVCFVPKGFVDAVKKARANHEPPPLSGSLFFHPPKIPHTLSDFMAERERQVKHEMMPKIEIDLKKHYSCSGCENLTSLTTSAECRGCWNELPRPRWARRLDMTPASGLSSIFQKVVKTMVESSCTTEFGKIDPAALGKAGKLPIGPANDRNCSTCRFQGDRFPEKCHGCATRLLIGELYYQNWGSKTTLDRNNRVDIGPVPDIKVNAHDQLKNVAEVREIIRATREDDKAMASPEPETPTTPKEAAKLIHENLVKALRNYDTEYDKYFSYQIGAEMDSKAVRAELEKLRYDVVFVQTGLFDMRMTVRGRVKYVDRSCRTCRNWTRLPGVVPRFPVGIQGECPHAKYGPTRPTCGSGCSQWEAKEPVSKKECRHCETYIPSKLQEYCNDCGSEKKKFRPIRWCANCYHFGKVLLPVCENCKSVEDGTRSNWKDPSSKDPSQVVEQMGEEIMAALNPDDKCDRCYLRAPASGASICNVCSEELYAASLGKPSTPGLREALRKAAEYLAETYTLVHSARTWAADAIFLWTANEIYAGQTRDDGYIGTKLGCRCYVTKPIKETAE